MECTREKDFNDDPQLHITFEQLKEGSIQCFAIYVPETVAYENRFEALQMVDIFIMKFYPYQV